jgi:hypothetical protein
MRKASARKAAAKKPAPSRPAAGPAQAAGAGVLVVNIIPQSLSAERNQDSEPMLAVNPTNANHIVATAFTPDPAHGLSAPYYVSTDGGNTWGLNAVVPGGEMTADITVAFSGAADKLYAGILRQDSPFPITRMNILRADDFSSNVPMTVLDDRQQPDQPFTQAATVSSGADTGKERLYVGNNDFAASPQTATLDVSLDAGSANPAIQSIRLEHRDTGGQDGPQVRTAVHSDGTVYSAFYGWRAQTGDFQTNTLVVTADVVVTRDDAWGAGGAAFQALVDPADNLPGLRVAQGVQFRFSSTGTDDTGQQRLGGTLSIAVDPRAQQSGTVYIAWGADEADTGFTIHVRRSTNNGAAWSANDLLTLPRATNAALAVNSNGVLALLYQQLTGLGPGQRWDTHVQRSNDGGVNWVDIMLATTPSGEPKKAFPDGFDPYLGDYIHMLAVGKDFYGIFSANNTPDNTNFPSGIVYQRNADFNTRRLLGLDNATEVQVSIDPFFFKLTG